MAGMEDIKVNLVTLQPTVATSATSNIDYSDNPLLPPTKIKRQYKCTVCSYTTINPRLHLHHRKNAHGHKIKVVECPYCVYACQYRQKLHRHLRLVHNYPNGNDLAGSTSNHLYPQQQQLRDQYDYQHQQLQDRRQQQQQLQQFDFLRSHHVSALASQLIPFQDTTAHNEPVDLSFPETLKQLIKSVALLEK